MIASVADCSIYLLLEPKKLSDEKADISSSFFWKETLLYTDHVKSINVFMLHYYIMQKTFSQINLKHSTYIKTRYDNLYLENINNTQLNQIYDFLDDEIPTIATPAALQSGIMSVRTGPCSEAAPSRAKGEGVG